MEEEGRNEKRKGRRWYLTKMQKTLERYELEALGPQENGFLLPSRHLTCSLYMLTALETEGLDFSF